VQRAAAESTTTISVDTDTNHPKYNSTSGNSCPTNPLASPYFFLLPDRLSMTLHSVPYTQAFLSRPSAPSV